MKTRYAMSGHAGLLILLMILLLLPACTAPVEVTTQNTHDRPDLTPHYNHRPVDLVDRLNRPDLIDTLRDARRVEDVLPSVAAERYLDAARQAYVLMVDPQTPETDRALIIAELYNRAVAGYVRVAPPNRPGLVKVSVGLGSPPGAADFDRYTPAADVRIQGLRDHHIVRGVGAPLIAFRDNTQTPETFDVLYPVEGVTRPLTAVLHFDDQSEPELALYDPRMIHTIDVRSNGGAERVEFPLAMDFSAPYADLLSRTQELAGLGFAAMLDPTESEDRLGVYLLEDYDPNKTPLLLIHGLMSTPLTWIEMTNAVYGDPELRDKYQVWHFLYPTASCPYYSAFYLRTKLDETRKMLDPELDDFASQDVVVVGHSMGGILARTLVSDPGMDGWNIAFTVGPDQLEGDPQAIGFLEDVYIYEPRPYVKRVVFVATPHRGSDFANNLIGAFGRSLVRLPRECVTKTIAIARANRDRLQPGYGPWLLNGPPSSIDILRPESPASVAPDLIPIVDGVAYHSIIGTRADGVVDGTGTSDGIVEYWSSHLDGAASEKLVPSGHNAHDHPEAIAELKRILREHLDTPTPVARLAPGP